MQYRVRARRLHDIAMLVMLEVRWYEHLADEAVKNLEM